MTDCDIILTEERDEMNFENLLQFWNGKCNIWDAVGAVVVDDDDDKNKLCCARV
jgi:hypothetical protein